MTLVVDDGENPWGREKWWKAKEGSRIRNHGRDILAVELHVGLKVVGIDRCSITQVSYVANIIACVGLERFRIIQVSVLTHIWNIQVSVNNTLHQLIPCISINESNWNFEYQKWQQQTRGSRKINDIGLKELIKHSEYGNRNRMID